MKRSATVGLCMVAVLGATAASAFAVQPVFTTKVEVGRTAGPVKVKGTIGAATFEDTSARVVHCTDTSGATASGEVTGPTTVENYVATFTGCVLNGTSTCETPSDGSGVIVTETLYGTLGNITPTLPGLRLYNQTTRRGGRLALFFCGGIEVIGVGSVMASLSGASGTSVEEDKLAASIFKLTYAQSHGIQKYTRFAVGEGEAGTEQAAWTFNGGPLTNAGVQYTVSLESTPVKGNLGITK